MYKSRRSPETRAEQAPDRRRSPSYYRRLEQRAVLRDARDLAQRIEDTVVLRQVFGGYNDDDLLTRDLDADFAEKRKMRGELVGDAPEHLKEVLDPPVWRGVSSVKRWKEAER